jgi:peptide subunit release factor 1 (eRF1)
LFIKTKKELGRKLKMIPLSALFRGESMIGNKVKFTCKNCGWTTSIREEWADLKPKRCMNKKCNTSFMKSPDSLVVELPSKEEVSEEPKKVRKKKDESG